MNSSAQAIIVAAPNGLHRNWHKVELPKHCHESEYVSYCWEGTPTSQKAKKQIERFLNHPAEGKKRFFLINVEALRTQNGYSWVSAFIGKAVKEDQDIHFIIDESTCIKNPKAQQTKAVMKLRDWCDKAWILNGTPITQGPLDLYSQCKFLNKNSIPFNSYTAFKSYFAVEEVMTLQNRSFRRIVDYKNIPQLTKLIEPFSLRLEKKDCLDLPEKTFTQHMVVMTPEQERHYAQLKDLCLTMLESGEIMTADMALVQLLRLHQITTGFFKSDDGTVTPIPNRRIEALMSIAEITSPLVIFCAYRENVAQVTESLTKTFGDKSVVTYTGETKGEDRTNAVQRFQDGDAQFFVGTSAAAKGLTLHRASTVVYFSNNYSLETRLQSQDRIHRIGQENKCTYIDLVSENTVDVAILNALNNKKEIAKSVLDDLKHMIQ